MLCVEHRGPLAADFRRYYGLSLAGLRDSGIPLSEAADLAAYLPDDSQTAKAMRHVPAQSEFLRSIEYSLRILRWQPTTDGRAGLNVPLPRLWPWESLPAEDGVIVGDGMTADEVNDFLGWDTPD